jgi:hypothetical protein
LGYSAQRFLLLRLHASESGLSFLEGSLNIHVQILRFTAICA